MTWIPLNEFYKEALEREKKGKISSYFAVIPHYVLEDEKLTPTEKLLFGEINSLVNKFGYCYATNRHFSDTLKFSKGTIKTGLTNLNERGYIKIEVEKNKMGTYRKIWITCKKPVEKEGIKKKNNIKNEPRGSIKNEPPKENTQIDNTLTILKF